MANASPRRSRNTKRGAQETDTTASLDAVTTGNAGRDGTAPLLLFPQTEAGSRPELPPMATSDRIRDSLTDVGNAERFVERHRNKVRYVLTVGWFFWDGTRWQRDVDRVQANEYAIETIRAISVDIANGDMKLAGEIVRHIRDSLDDSRLNAMLKQAQGMRAITVEKKQLDTDPWLLNVRNGTLDLRTGKLRAHDPADLITKLVAVDYKPKARSKVWERFLDDITLGDKDLEQYLQRAAGYTLTGVTTEDVLFLLHGDGRSGKTTLLNVMAAILVDYWTTIDPETLMALAPGAAKYELATLPGTRFVTTSETDRGKRFDSSLLKRVTGGDTISARQVYQSPFIFKPQFKLWILTNHLPQNDDTSRAMRKRVKVLPFDADFSEVKDGDLEDKLLKFASAILAWMVHGCMAWRRSRDLSEPACVREATARYLDEQDVFGAFVQERCVTGEGCGIASLALLEDFNAWRQERAERPVDARELRRLAEAHGYRHGRTAKITLYRGIALKAAESCDGQRRSPATSSAETK